MDIETVNQVTPILYDNGYRILQIYSFAETDEKHVGMLLDWMSPPVGAKVVDMGCGVGEVARLMKESRPDLNFTLVNLSDVQLAYCPPEDQCLANFLAVPRASASYDCASFMFAIGHENIDAGLREAFRLLKDDGTLFVCDMERFGGDGAAMAELVQYQVLRRDEFRAAAVAAGFEEIACQVPDVVRNIGPEVCGADYEQIFGDVGPIVWKFRKISALERHKNIVLQFSGGKDSIACLMLLKEHLHRITVLWMNTGAAFPETIAQMASVRAMCPNFIEVSGAQPESIASQGYPVDVLPLRNDKHVQFLTQQERLPLQGFMACCFNNLMQPMHLATLELGATLIIRGQKAADHHKSPVTSGAVLGGVEFWFPIDDWTDAKVMEYVADSGLLPMHYEDANTSLDCWDCTAYRAENQWKQPYLERHHPDKAAEVRRRLVLIKQEIMNDLQHMGV